MKNLLFTLMMVVAVTGAHAENLTMTFSDLVAYDGDTIRSKYVPIKGLPPISFRLAGIDTPEMRGKCEKEKANAIRAREFLNLEIKGKPTTVEFLSWDKYGGRVISRVRNANGEDLVQKLIAAGYGRPYDGGTKKGWCSK